jgi:prepilin-type processing-associated H-X9-DG protein
LVELLVVIGIVAVLSAFVLGALVRAKTAAQRIQCAANLRQLGIAAQMYWDENEGRPFPYLVGATNGGMLYWFGWIETWNGGNEGERAFDLRQGALYPYLQGSGVQICPSLSYSRRFKLKATGAAYGYGYNVHLASSGSAVNMQRMARPADVVVLADAAQINDFQAPASPENPLLEEFYYVSLGDLPNAHFRHQHLANAAYCDGHVDQEKPAPDSLDSRLPGEYVGRLRRESLVP